MTAWIALFGGLGCAAAIGLWRAQRLMYAGLSFLTTLLTIAALFAVQAAAFVAVAQIVVYIGGILVLLLFGMMFMSAGNPEVLEVRPRTNWLWVVLVVLIGGGLVRQVLVAAPTLPAARTDTAFAPKQIGTELVAYHALSFELIAVLLLVALIGATFIASRK